MMTDFSSHRVWVAGYNGPGFFNRAINIWTDGEFSHVELVVDGRFYSSSAQDGGVRVKDIEIKPERWIIEPLPWADAEIIKDRFKKIEGLPYGTYDLIAKQLLRLPVPDGRGIFCSDCCAWLLGMESRTRNIDPTDFMLLCRWVTAQYNRLTGQ